jgi:glycosyltransferase involved in cell wall biosynthesis
LSLSRVEFFAQRPGPQPGDLPLDAVHTPDTITAARPDLVNAEHLRRSLRSRVLSGLRRHRLPVPGPYYPGHVSEQFPRLRAFFQQAVQETLEQGRPDFVFVSLQDNALALTLATNNLDPRLILVAHESEVARARRVAGCHRGLARVALAWEADRAASFERENLARYDAVIAAGEADRRHFLDAHGFAAERVLVVPRAVDPDYWGAVPRRPDAEPVIVFLGDLAAPENRHAVCRLAKSIMPAVWGAHPAARLVVVSPGPSVALPGSIRGPRIEFVFDAQDPRPHLARATAACLPLAAASPEGRPLEVLAAGLPLVCSPATVDGLALDEGKHFLPGSDDAQLAAALVTLLAEPGRGEVLAREAAAQVARCHSWRTSLAGFASWLEALAELPHRHAGVPPARSTPERHKGGAPLAA